MNESHVALGIDAGGSSASWLVMDSSGRELAGGRTGAVTGHVFSEAGSDVLSSEGEASSVRLREIAAGALQAARPAAVVLGATGLEAGSRSANYFEQLLADALGLDRARVSVSNDMDIAYRTTFEPGQGVLVYGGTGSVAWHIARDGSALRVGGHGYLIDDAGGGYWIGRAALARVLRWHDEQGAPAAGRPLADEVYAQLGAREWDDVREEVYVKGRSRVAALAQAVARAAARGDAAALAIQREAGEELARLANVALARLGMILPVAVAGGVSRQGPVLLDALRARLPEGTPFQTVTDEPVLGAAKLALELARRPVPG